MRVLLLVLLSSVPTALTCVVAAIIAGKNVSQTLEIIRSTSGLYFVLSILWFTWLTATNDILILLGIRKFERLGIELKEIPAYNGLEGDTSQPETFRQKMLVSAYFILFCSFVLTLELVRSS
jgi:hypothetical protein